MCGIAGIVGEKDDHWIDDDVIHRMCQTIIHRGPDDEGVFVKHGTGLGMRRLSIIDLAGGRQPVFNEDRTCWVVFNGEIYNFRDLRCELESKGHRFQSNTDTEVIVHLYEEFGAVCVRKLRGMFAFALFDERKRSLLLARDRLGKKPLHYALSGGRLLFGSEIKAILAAAPELATTDSRALLQYFYFGYIPDPATAFLQIKKLPPGHLLEFENGKAHVRQYWDLPEYATFCPNSDEECLAELEEKLAEAVRIRLIADVPIGALLSGGTDSSTIVALMARASNRPVKTFTVGFKHSDFNEAPYARSVADKFGTEHYELTVEPMVGETVEKLAQSLEEPFGDSSMLPTYLISSLARKYVTVVLSGDGGDEAFAGYDRYRIHLQDRESHRIPEWAGKLYRRQIYPRLSYDIPGRNLAYSYLLPWPERYIEAVTLVPYQRNFSILAEDFVMAASRDRDPLDLFRKFIREAPGSDPLSRVLYLDTKTYLPGDILTKVDRMSMAASLETRVPLLDHVFLEWVTSLTSKWKMRKGRQKFILAKLAERVGVPQEATKRPKQGFALPLLHWMRHELKDPMLSLLLEPKTIQRGYFNEQGVRFLLNEFLRGRTDDYLVIWRLMMFELWQRVYLERLTAQVLTTCETTLRHAIG
ncbi:MAG TPA: asparagine synthase (glutamine-hydrolyzing) [Candidatus Sulfotelmatobacter sp.]|nr:asparagine synthase (glutamine-hydrolyzing) [Candidatus Sulfotelmatobacter sp.]